MKQLFLRQRWTLLWDFVVSGWQAARGMYVLSSMPYPKVTIFGATHAKEDSVYAKKAEDLARRFKQADIAVITGGGPGIMWAANCGAEGKTIGIGVKGIDDTFMNPCAQVIKVNHFYTRKWLMLHYSIGFVIFPGGIGTADELFELLNSSKHKLLETTVIVLIGTQYWKLLLDWMHDTVLKAGYINPQYHCFFKVTDDLDEAFEIIHASRHIKKPDPRKRGAV